MTKLPAVVLVSGLSRAGKSSFAVRFCNAYGDAAHLPLDKYFRTVPAGTSFREWVQSPSSVDWETLSAHLARLASGLHCNTPALDWAGSGARLSDGGEEWHPRSVHVPGGAAVYVIPGCHAFNAPVAGSVSQRVFIYTPFAVVARRLSQAESHQAESVVAAHQPGYRQVIDYQNEADHVVDGSETNYAADRMIFERIRRALGG